MKRTKRSQFSHECSIFFFVLFWFSKLRKVRVIQLLLGLLLWTSNPHFKHITKSGSDKRHWREQQNSSTLLWLDCTNYRTGMNKSQQCSWEGGFPIWMCAGASSLLTLQSLINDQELLCFYIGAQKAKFKEKGCYHLLLLGFNYKSPNHRVCWLGRDPQGAQLLALNRTTPERQLQRLWR